MKKYLTLLVGAGLISLTSCTKNSEDSACISDASLSTITTSSDGFLSMRTSKQNNNEEWNIKMNDVAAKAYAEGLKNFPVNSMIVKEKHDASGKISGYDVMYKAPADINSHDGWLWSQYASDGKVIYDVNERGASCQSCHAGDKNSRMVH